MTSVDAFIAAIFLGLVPKVVISAELLPIRKVG